MSVTLYNVIKRMETLGEVTATGQPGSEDGAPPSGKEASRGAPTQLGPERLR